MPASLYCNASLYELKSTCIAVACTSSNTPSTHVNISWLYALRNEASKNTHNLDQIYSRSKALYIHRYNFMRQVLLQSKEFTLPFPAAEKFPRHQGRWCQTRATAFSLHANPFVLGTNVMILHWIVLGTIWYHGFVLGVFIMIVL